MADVEVRKNDDEHQYEAYIDGERVGFAQYQLTDQLVVFTHTEVEDKCEGMGVGSALARAALDDVRAEGVRARCCRCAPSSRAGSRHHADYRDLVYGGPEEEHGPGTDMSASEHVDVVVVGAGLSGIGAAYRLQHRVPRPELRRPRGARRDRWHLGPVPLPRGPVGLRHVHPRLPVQAVDARRSRSPTPRPSSATSTRRWRSSASSSTSATARRWSAPTGRREHARWTLTLETPDGPRTMTCGFLYACAGYFDYDRGLHAGVPRHRGLRGRGRAPAVLARGPGVRRPAGRGHRQRRDRRDAGAGDGRAGRPRDHAPAQPHLDRRASRVATSSPTRLARSCCRRARPPGHPDQEHRCSRWAVYTYCQRFPDRARRLLLGLTTRSSSRDARAGGGALHPDVRPVGPAVLRRPRRRPVPHHPARRRRRRHRPHRRVRARGHPAEERPRARGRRGRDRDGADPEAVRRDRAVRRRPAVDLHEQFVWQGAMLTASPTSRSASATPTPRGPCAPT